MTRYAVIASNSFSGGYCVDGLLDRPGAKVLGISRSPEKSDLFVPYRRRKNPAFEFHQIDLNTQPKELWAALDGFRPEVVINFAAQGEVGSSWKHPEHWFETNAVGIVKLTNGLKDRDYLKRYVHISTPEVYGSVENEASENAPMNPSTPYAASKAAGDMFVSTLVKQYKFPAVTIRSTNVYGKHQQLYRIIPRTIISIKKGRRIPLHGGGKAAKAYIHIRDVIDGVLKAADSGKAGECYHLSPDGDIPVADLVRRVCALMGADFDKVAETVEDRPGQDSRYSISSRKARTELSWKPAIALNDGLREMVDWVEKDWARLSEESLEYIHQL
jgi:dTDP-glucose 4,6-dehydratase